MKKSLNILLDETCYSMHEKYEVSCQRKSCNNWINHPTEKNCILIASKSGPKTLQDVGKIYGLTRMRICQIEKNIYEKLKKVIQSEE